MIKGIKEVCTKSKNCRGLYGSYFIQIFYNAKENRVFYEEHCSENSRCICDNPDIYEIGIISEPMKMVDIETMVNQQMEEYKYYQLENIKE